jgi:hypothetical protein
MSLYQLHLYEDRIEAGAEPIYLPRAPRAIYVVEGDAMLEYDLGAQHQPANTGWVGGGQLTILTGARGAKLWRWELQPVQRPVEAGFLSSAPRAHSISKLSAEITLDAGFDWLMRCDRVEFPPGGIAHTHVHQGPGIRCTLHGEIAIEIDGARHTHGAGEAWLELGRDPVLAPTTPHAETAFIRCFLLPQACRGRSSIRYVKIEDAQRPKDQRYHVFAERLLTLGGN